MDLDDLRGKKIRIVMECISHDGGGSMTWPGPQTLSLAGSFSQNTEGIDKPGYDKTIESASASGVMAYQVSPSYLSWAFSTQPDAAYLRAAVEMKARHEGIIITDSQPEAVLFILVDVLGTNRSRTEELLVVDEDYQASCELTYYAIDTLTGHLVFRGRQSGAVARYDEKHRFGSSQIQVDRTIASSMPTVPSLDRLSTASAQTQPTTRTATTMSVSPAVYQANMQPLMPPARPSGGGDGKK
jgi:hypothetical protein